MGTVISEPEQKATSRRSRTDRKPFASLSEPRPEPIRELPAARILEVRDLPAGRDSVIRRIKLVSADLKYSPVRVEETLRIDPVTKEEILMSSRAMAAGHIIVQLNHGIQEPELHAWVGANGGRIQTRLDDQGTYLLAFDDPALDTVPDAIRSSQDHPVVFRFAEPDFLVSIDQTIPDDPRFDELWGLNNTGQLGGTEDADLDAPEAWDTTVGNNVVVAVVDTGVDYSHEDLVGNIWTNPGEIPANGIDDDGNGYIDDLHGIDAYNADADPSDDHGHGTHVSGTIAGKGNNGIGIAGVCWQARIMGVKFLSAGGYGYTSGAIECIRYAARMGARVMNNSWGGGGYSQALSDAIENANQSNSLFCAAAGNSGSDNDASPHYPSSYTNANIIAVAASTRTDSLASFSCYGAASVDLAAPGSSILSALPGNGYASWSGTSMATPHCSGVAALLLSRNPALSVTELKRIILENTDPVGSFAGKTVTGGRLNLLQALNHVFGVCFDKPEYFSDSRAVLTLIDPQFAGDPTHDIQLTTSDGDVETLTLHAQDPGGYVFTNGIFVGFGAAIIGNGNLEGMHGTLLRASYADPSGGGSIEATARVVLGLDIRILTPPSPVPFSSTNIAVSGINNGNVNVSMIVSNDATGDAHAFTATNSWTAPAVTLSDAQGINTIHVFGINAYGFADHESVVITRYGPSSNTNYVSTAGTHLWPYSSWATAATNINAALGAASTGNVILVDDGTYDTETVELNRPMTLKSLRGPLAARIDGKDVRRCLAITAAALADGFTLVHGAAPHGGGAYLSDGEIRNSLVHSNTASDYGGGIYFAQDGLASQCAIGNNTAYGGGGIEFDGGGTASACEILENTALYYGGGADCWGGGTLTNCLIRDNRSGGYGGGVECWEGGTLYGSTMIGNHADYDGGGVESFYWNRGAVVYNSLIAGNSAGRYGGGADLWGGGVFWNCTIIGNTAGMGGGVYCLDAADIRNSIIYYNQAAVGDNILNHGQTGHVYVSTCALPLQAGAGNIASPPLVSGLQDAHLLAGSPCIDSGNNAFADGTDIDETARIVNGVVDRGCDEFVGNDATGPLTVSIQADSTNVSPGYATEFNAFITGRPSHFVWDFAGGPPITNLAQISLSWPAPGSYPVILTAYNTDFPAGAAATVTVRVSSSPLYVSPTGGHVPPFGSWATAATNLQSAIDAAQQGGTILVTNGTYDTGGYAQGSLVSRIGMYKPLLVRSINGPAWTFIRGNGPLGPSAVRCAYLVKGAVLSGFTLTNGHTVATGDDREVYGGGAYLDGGGTLSNCVVRSCQADERGGGVYLRFAGTLVNCLIVANQTAYYGGGIFMEEGGFLQHCTVSGNTATYNGGGLYAWNGGHVHNSIVYFNTALYDPNIRANGAGSLFEQVCTTPTNGLPGGTGCIASPPMFVDTNAPDYRLLPGSPGVDTATNGTGIAADLDGRPRPLDGDLDGISTPDMGAYEFLHVSLDTDGDGIPDAWEMTHGLNRLVNDAAGDPDGDGLNNLQEYLYSTNPHVGDTDGDNYPDPIEVLSGSNPLDPAVIPAVNLTITSPTAASTFTTTNSSVDLAGTLAAHAAVTNLSIVNNRHIASDICPVAADWSFVGMPLYSGNNAITITAQDVAGRQLGDTITITRSLDARYNDLLFSGALVQEITFPDNLVPGSSVTVQWKALSYVPLRGRLGTGSKTQGWYLFKNATYAGSQVSPWNIAGRNAMVYSYQCAFVVPTNAGDLSIWFNHAQMDGTLYMSAVVPDGVDPRPDPVQSKLITRTIVGGGSNANPVSDASFTDMDNPFESSQQALMRSGGTITAIDVPLGNWPVGDTIACEWTVLSYAPIYSKLFLLNLADKRVLLQATGTLVRSQYSSWHIGSTYAIEYTFRTQLTVPDEAGVQQIYFLDMQQGLADASWMAGNIPAGVDPAPALFNGMYGRFIERTIVP